jgi:hypothetical protein
MKQFIRKNFILLLAFLLPILLIILVAVVTYLPSLLVSTNYNFIYSTCYDNVNYYNNCNRNIQNHFYIENGRVLESNISQTQDFDKNGVLDYKERLNDRIFLHDTVKNESREISLEEAQKLNLSELLTSPDGVTVSSSYERSGPPFFLFGGGYSSYGYYITKGKGRTKINLINSADQYYYQNNFKFLGWVLPGRN